MIALFFEVTPRQGQDDRYLEIAASLRPELEASGGVVYLDRLRSLARPRVLLSHQVWRDEASLARWRANGRHHGAQTAGRSAVFEDYRLRVGAIVAQLGEGGRILESPESEPYNDPRLAPERYVVVVRSLARAFTGSGGESWQSVYNEDQQAWVGAVPDRGAGLALLSSAAADPCVSAALLVLVSRDYGMNDRREAPQYFPAVRSQ